MLHCVPGLDLQDKVPTDGVLFNQVGRCRSGCVGVHGDGCGRFSTALVVALIMVAAVLLLLLTIVVAEVWLPRANGGGCGHVR